MTSRERVLCALNHEEPDRVPIFLGTSGVTSLLAPAYERLKTHLGIQKEPRLLSRPFQYARLDEEVMVRFGSDGRPLAPRPVPSPLRQEVSDTAFVDEWGIRWERRPGAAYYENLAPPLRHLSRDEIERYPWPNLAHPARFDGLAEEARALHENTPYAVVLLSGVTLHEHIYLMRGLDAWLMDLVADPDFAEALLNTFAALMLRGLTELLRHVGPYVDVIVTGDDLGMQDGPMMSPATYRRMLQPLHAKLIATIRQHTRAKVFFHTCGDVYPLLGGLIDAGVDVLNPVQVSARDMGDTARLKREFGRRLSFCGAIDTQWVLPHGTTDDVRAEVRRRLRDLAPGGGYILSAVHCIQPDVPLANVCALFDEALAAGRYPPAIAS